MTAQCATNPGACAPSTEQQLPIWTSQVADTPKPANVPLLLQCYIATMFQCICTPIFQCVDWRYSQTCRGFDHSSNQLSQNGTPHSFHLELRDWYFELEHSMQDEPRGIYFTSPSKFPPIFSDHSMLPGGGVILGRWRSHAPCPLITTNRGGPQPPWHWKINIKFPVSTDQCMSS